MTQDNPIVDAIRAELERDLSAANAARVAVAEQAGTVTLRGTVRSLHQRRTAIAIAKSCAGVCRVEDGLRIDPRDHWHDDQIRGMALQALVRSDAVPGLRIDVHVASGWLTLSGEVRHQSESDAAFEAVVHVPGVGGITNEIKVVTAGL
jgi:osmotically-inducible protein OsmY